MDWVTVGRSIPKEGIYYDAEGNQPTPGVCEEILHRHLWKWHGKRIEITWYDVFMVSKWRSEEQGEVSPLFYVQTKWMGRKPDSWNPNNSDERQGEGKIPLYSDGRAVQEHEIPRDGLLGHPIAGDV